VAKLRAKALRRNLTDAEAKLWVHLKRVKTVDTHFRKQVPVGNYIADFACMRGRLIIEVDGAQHGFDGGVQHDVKRTRFLESQGFRVLRFWNDDVLRDIEGVLDTIYAVLHGASDASVHSMSRRKALQDEAPSSPSMGEVSPKATEGVKSSLAGNG
jgi:very-short-patch-repair endonuclease